ncbi:MAG: hypothetical protein ACJ79I_03695 [Gemmatimonadaceae bacterium]
MAEPAGMKGPHAFNFVLDRRTIRNVARLGAAANWAAAQLVSCLPKWDSAGMCRQLSCPRTRELGCWRVPRLLRARLGILRCFAHRRVVGKLVELPDRPILGSKAFARMIANTSADRSGFVFGDFVRSPVTTSRMRLRVS